MSIRSIHIDELAIFIKKNNIDNVFLQPEFVSQNASINIHGIFAKDGQQKGVFLTETMPRLKILKAIATPKNMANCQLTFISSAQNPAKRNSEFKNVVEAITLYLDKLPGDVISISFPENWIDFQPFIWKKYKVTTQLTYQLELSESEEILFDNFSTERRKNVNKAEKEELIVKHIEPNKELLEMILGTFKRQRITADERAIDSVLFKTPSSSIISTMTFDINNNPLACNVCLVDSHKATYLFGGYSSENKHEGAGALAMWNSIKKAKERSIEIFDFEGSMIPQIEKYVRGFGGKIVPFYRVNKSSYLVEVLLKTKEKTRF